MLSSEVEVDADDQPDRRRFETQLTQERLSLAQMRIERRRRTRPAMEPVEAPHRHARRPRSPTLRSQLTDRRHRRPVAGRRCRASLLIAQADVQTRQLMLAQALQAAGNRPDRGQPPGPLPVAVGQPGRARRADLSARLREYAGDAADLRRHLPDDLDDRRDPARTGHGLRGTAMTTMKDVLDRRSDRRQRPRRCW